MEPPAMKLKGSCHCTAVSFELESAHPYPFNICYCSICRKTQGGGGYAINLSGDFETMRVEGDEYLTIYSAQLPDRDTSPAERNFCSKCGSALWVWDPRWPKLVHPFASAIDTPLPTPPEHTHLMLGSKADWVPVHREREDKSFDAYPDESIADWHRRHGFTD